MARLGRARLVPLFIHRDRGDPGRQCLRIEAPLEEPEGPRGGEEWTRSMTQALTGAIEGAESGELGGLF